MKVKSKIDEYAFLSEAMTVQNRDILQDCEQTEDEAQFLQLFSL
jgi:hypothetical protein